MKWLGSFKKFTHVLALAGSAGIAWALSESGQAVIGGFIKAYPKLSGLAGVLVFLGTTYRSPKA